MYSVAQLCLTLFFSFSLFFLFVFLFFFFYCVWLFVTTWTAACQAPSVGFFPARILEYSFYSSRLLFPTPGDLPNPGTEPGSLKSPALQANSLPLSHQGKPQFITERVKKIKDSLDDSPYMNWWKCQFSWWFSKPYKSDLLFHLLPPLPLLPPFHSTPSAQVSLMFFEHARNAAMTGSFYCSVSFCTFLKTHLHRENCLILHPFPTYPLLCNCFITYL